MEVKFHMPGLRQNFPLNMLMISYLEQEPEIFRDGVVIASNYGEFPTSLWNGGRPSNYDQCDKEYITNVVHAINSKNVAVRYTYTNMTLCKADCDDPYCNFCMQTADNGMNGVILFSPILEKYIRKNYPSFKIISSTCKELRTIERVKEELAKDYDLVVLDYNFNNKFDILEQISEADRSRVEILVNALCIPDCPRRGEHYRNIADNQRIMLRNRNLPKEKQQPLKPWHCEYGEYNSLYDSMSYSTHVSPEDIWEKYVPMGFNNFKIEGRTGNLFSLVETYCHYLIKPEHQGKARIKLLNNLASNKIITVHHPQPKSFQ